MANKVHLNVAGGPAKGKARAKAFHIRAAGLTDVGRVRARNEDEFLVEVRQGVFIVADGLGGHARGDVASRMMVDLLPPIIRRRAGEMPVSAANDDAAIRTMLAGSLSEVSRDIRAKSKDKVEYTDMGATAVVALLTRHHAHIAHMGDSRAYLFSDGFLQQLTQDHSFVGLLMRHGAITPQEAEHHPAKNYVTRYVGMEGGGEPEVQTIDLQPGDRYLLCSDGLWGMVPSEDLARILAERRAPPTICRELIATGNAAGGHDNLTAVVMDILGV